MELFHEIYSSYINVVQCILTEAHQSPITLGRMEEIAAENAFAESALAILPKLTGDDWPLLTPCGDHTFSFPTRPSYAYSAQHPSEILAEGPVGRQTYPPFFQ